MQASNGVAGLHLHGQNDMVSWIVDNVGTSFESFLETEGIRDEVYSAAMKRVLAWQIEEAMKQQHISKSEMARRMKTSRVQLQRLLDPSNDRIQIDTLQRAASAVGRRLKMELV